MNYTNRMGLVAGLALAAFSPVGLAQTASSTTTDTAAPATAVPTTSQAQGAAPASTDNTAVQMEKFQVNDVPIEQQILPTSRPFTSVFGTEDNILDVPRNVTIISREQMDVIDIQDVTEFSKLTSSSYTDSTMLKSIGMPSPLSPIL